MPTVIRRSESLTVTTRRQTRSALGWELTRRVWNPPADVYETDTGYVVMLEVAGMREGDFDVVFDGGTLYIEGHRQDVKERRAYHQMEIHFGKFSTAVAVPGAVDLENSRAEYKDGFLTVRMPKTKQTDVKVEE